VCKLMLFVSQIVTTTAEPFGLRNQVINQIKNVCFEPGPGIYKTELIINVCTKHLYIFSKLPHITKLCSHTVSNVEH